MLFDHELFGSTYLEKPRMTLSRDTAVVLCPIMYQNHRLTDDFTWYTYTHTYYEHRAGVSCHRSQCCANYDFNIKQSVRVCHSLVYPSSFLSWIHKTVVLCPKGGREFIQKEIGERRRSWTIIAYHLFTYIIPIIYYIILYENIKEKKYGNLMIFVNIL